jgi:N-acyl-D-amino-acid deacylase
VHEDRQGLDPSRVHLERRRDDGPADDRGPGPAVRLTRRGRLVAGHFADIVVFDAERIIDNSTYDDHCRFPGGIPYVVVNGLVAVDGERCTGTLAGQAVP